MPKFHILFLASVAAWCAARAEPVENGADAHGGARVFPPAKDENGARVFLPAKDGASAQLALARALLNDGRPDDAFAGYQIILEAFGEPAARNKALAGQARARFEQGRYAESARLFQRAADNAEDTPEWRAEWLSRAADAVFASGRHAEAARMYRHVYTLFPDGALAGEMLLRAADALARAGDTPSALEAFARAAETDPALAAEARVRQGEILARQGEVAACAALVEPVIAEHAHPALRGRAFLAMGRAHFAAGELEEALAAFESAKDIAETAHEAAWLCVPVLQHLGRVDDAREMARSAQEPGFSNPALESRVGKPGLLYAGEARLWLLRDAYNSGRLDEVPALAEAFAAASPRDARLAAVWVWSARAAALSGNFNRAVDDIGRLRREFPSGEELPGGVFVQGVALLELGRFEEAVMVFDDLVTRLPESAWTTAAWLRKGDALYLLGAGRDAWFAAASAAYEEALLRYDITPAERFEALYKSGRALGRVNREADALVLHAANVAEPFLDAWQAGDPATRGAEEWFARAVSRAADLLAAEDAFHLLESAASHNAPGAAEARARMKLLKHKGE